MKKLLLAAAIAGICAPAYAQLTPKHYSVAVGILRYQSPPVGAAVGSPTEVQFRKDLPNMTIANAQVALDQVKAWYAKETYGRVLLDFTIAQADLPGNPSCNFDVMLSDLYKVVKPTEAHDAYIAMMPYTCWKSRAMTYGGQIDGYTGYSLLFSRFGLETGTIAHELGHAFGLLNSGSMLAPATTVTEYGNWVDQMGSVTNAGLTHFMAHHKEKLKAIVSKLPCKSVALRPIYTSPDVIACGDVYAEYLDDWHQVWITKVAYASGNSGGGDDEYTLARLNAGQSWTDGVHTIKHVVTGQIQVTP